MFIRFILLFVILIFQNCKQSQFLFESLINKKGNEDKRYHIVINPNGIQMYNKPNNFDSKIGVIGFGEKFENQKDMIEFGSVLWIEIIYKNKVGWIISNREIDYRYFWFGYGNQKAVAQVVDAPIYEYPTEFSNVINRVNQFTILNCSFVAIPYESDPDLNEVGYPVGTINAPAVEEWYETKTTDGKSGYISSSHFQYYQTDSEKYAIEAAKIGKLYYREGRFKIVNKKPILFSIEMLKPYSKDINFVFQDKFYETRESRLINGNRYYKARFDERIFTKDKKKTFLSWLDAYISEQDIQYYTPKEFTEYTVLNTTFKADKKAMDAMRRLFEKYSLYRDYSNFNLEKIFLGRNMNGNFYLASIGEHKLILQKIENEYKIISREISSNPKLVDIDHDGIYELDTMQPGRPSNYPVRLHFSNGKYKESK